MRSALSVWQRSRRRTGELQQGGEMLRCVIRNNHQCVALLDTGVAAEAVCGRVPQLDTRHWPGCIAAVEQHDRRRVLEAGAGERCRIGMPGHNARNWHTLEHPKLGRDQWCQRGVGMMYEPAGSMNVLADMVEPKTCGIALEAIERTAAHDLDRPYLRDGNGQQQIGAALAHVARELPFFAHVARQEIELRPTDDTNILRVLRWRGFAETQACSIAAGLCNGKRETRGIETILGELTGAVFACHKHTPWRGNREQPNSRVDVAANRDLGRGIIEEPLLPRVSAEDGPLLAAGKLDARHTFRRKWQDADRLHMGARRIDRPAAADCNDAEQASHQAGGHDAETARK